MLTFLLICTALLLVLTIFTYWQMVKKSASEFLDEWDRAEMGNGGLQVLYALTGIYVFYILTVMNYVQPTFYLGLLTAFDSLLFLYAMHRHHHSGTLPSYYRSGVGLYVSGLFQVIFLVAALYYLFPQVL